MTTNPQTRRQTVEYFLQTRQPDDTWEDSSSFMDDLDWARQRLDVRQEKYPAFEHRIARRATTVVVEPVDAATASGPSAPVDRAELRDRIAAAMREHWLCTIRDEADADGNLPCRCGDWREPGAEVDDENDWDSHLADVALAVLPAPVDQAAVLAEVIARITGMPGYPRLVLPEEIVAELRRVAVEEQQPETQAAADLPARLEAVLTERFTELGNPFSEMRRHEQGPDGWPASHSVGPHQVAEVLRELLATDAPAAVAQPGKEG